jgi:hypothetical protein
VSPTRVDPLRTHVAHAEFGANRFFGFSVPDLAGKETLTSMAALAISGRRLTPEERGVLDDLAVSLTLADPRIWPLKIARLVSSYGGCLPAMVATMLGLEDAVIGHWTTRECAHHFMALAQEAPDLTPESLHAPIERRLREGQALFGFGVPFRPQDERLLCLRKRIVERGRDGLTYWRLLESASVAMRSLKRLEPNMTAGVTATLLDLGFTPNQIPVLAVVLGQTDFLANAVEGSEQRAAALRRLPDDCIRYVGKLPRVSPRAREESE